MSKLQSLFVALALAACLPAGAWAGCTVTSGTLAFGRYLATHSKPATGAGSLTMSCDADTTYSIKLSAGQSGTFSSRAMHAAAAGARLDYNLYTDPARTILWGDGTGASSLFQGSAAANQHKTITVYGLIPARQRVAAGNYSDTITITVSY